MARQGRIISVDSEGRVESVDETGARARLEQLAWLLDSSIPIPGTRLTVGVDAIVGLIPILGDLIGVLLSSFILSEAARLGAPRLLLMRMGFNVAVEGVIGIIPLAGDLFDAAWKANQRNVRLLGKWLDQPHKAERSNRLFAAGIAVAVAASLGLLGYLGFELARWLVGLF